jgi:hypothetical protein
LVPAKLLVEVRSGSAVRMPYVDVPQIVSSLDPLGRARGTRDGGTSQVTLFFHTSER